MTYKIFKAFLIFLMLIAFSRGALASQAVDAINNFAFTTAAKLEQNSGDYFFSPYSIISAFGMVYAGSEGATAQEIEAALGISPDIHSELGELMTSLAESQAFFPANRVWLRTKLTILDEYKNILKNFYKSSLQELDFLNKTEESRKIINDWVSENTKGKIQNLLSNIEPDTQMILTNAVYFNAAWQERFNKKLTRQEKFFNDGKNFLMVDMMKQRDDFYYAELNGYKFVKLPYEDGRFSMVAVLPPEGQENLSQEIFQRGLSSMKSYEVDLWLPKFKTEKKYELKELFESMGIILAFSNFADFFKITEQERIKIDAVIHQTFIDVDEEKTEAAAATAITMVRATAMPRPKKLRAEFHATRPFIYFIMDDQTGTILFMGRQKFSKSN